MQPAPRFPQRDREQPAARQHDSRLVHSIEVIAAVITIFGFVTGIVKLDDILQRDSESDHSADSQPTETSPPFAGAPAAELAPPKNTVLEITSAGNRLCVRERPSTSAQRIEMLMWGDRVMWTGDTTNAEGYRWLNVRTGDGQTGWMVNVEGWTVPMDPTYKTPGIGRGVVIAITASGTGSHCRERPSTSAPEIRKMREHDEAVVISGPSEAEYWVWWQYRLANNDECWLVDVQGWLEVITEAADEPSP